MRVQGAVNVLAEKQHRSARRPLHDDSDREQQRQSRDARFRESSASVNPFGGIVKRSSASHTQIRRLTQERWQTQ